MPRPPTERRAPRRCVAASGGPLTRDASGTPHLTATRWAAGTDTAMGVLRGRVSRCRTACRATPARVQAAVQAAVHRIRLQEAIRPLSFLVDPACTLPPPSQRQAIVDAQKSHDDDSVTELMLEVAGRTLHVRGAGASHRVEPEVAGVLPWTGGFIWDSAPLLASYVGTMSLTGARVLELGTGTGLVGLAAACTGAGQVVLTDREVHMAMQNRDANFEVRQRSRVLVRELQWGVRLQQARAELGVFDVILGSDLLYLPQSHAALAATIDALAADGTQVFLTSPDPHDQFFSRMQLLGFHCEDLSKDATTHALMMEQWQNPSTPSQRVIQQPWEAAMFPERSSGQRGPVSLTKLTKRTPSG